MRIFHEPNSNLSSRYFPVLALVLTLGLAIFPAASAFECANDGAASTAPDDNGSGANTACGDGAEATGGNSTAVGGFATAPGGDSTAVGNNATASASISSALGRNTTASGFGSTAVGDSALASGFESTAVGESAAANGERNTILGSHARVLNSTFSNATALGFHAQVQQSNAMVLGSIPGINVGTEISLEYVNVGIGTAAPMSPLHIRREDGTLEFLRLESDAAGGAQDRAMMDLTNNGGIRFQFTNALTANAWRFQAGTGGNDNFEITKVGSGKLEMVLSPTGNMTIAGTLTELSDAAAKQDISELEGEMVLARLEQLPVSEWRYKASPESKHVGPMAQDFHTAFGLGEDDTHISPRDMAGVNMAAIKAQQDRIKAIETQHEQAMAAKDTEIEELRTGLQHALQAMDSMKARLIAVEANNSMVRASIQ